MKKQVILKLLEFLNMFCKKMNKSCLSVSDKMEESIQESLQKAEALRQSILKKAFSGELI